MSDKNDFDMFEPDKDIPEVTNENTEIEAIENSDFTHADNLKTKMMLDTPSATFSDSQETEQPRPKQIRKKNSRIAAEAATDTVKVTSKAVWLVVRKILTYTLNILLTILIIGVVTGAIVATAFLIYIKQIDPTFNDLDNLKYDSSLNTTIKGYDEDGNITTLAVLNSSENRMWATYDEIPQNLINAYVAVEDQRYFEHTGVDLQRTVSAIANFFVPSGSGTYGGSTITQQLIKNVSGDNETTIQRKVQEILRALEVNDKFSKEEILEMYLNTISLGHNAYGVKVAAETYFGKSLADLTIEECASLAAIAKSPSAYNPLSNPRNNLERRNVVLYLMHQQGLITDLEYDEAYDKPLVLASDETVEYEVENPYSYYIETVIDDVLAALQETGDYPTREAASLALYSGGLTINICQDASIQKIVEEIYSDAANWPIQDDGKSQSAACIIDQSNGHVLAIVGGRGVKTSNRTLNRATHSRRQCGSSIKPLSVYTPAIDLGILSYGGVLEDYPPIYFESSDRYYPNNAQRYFQGYVSFKTAIWMSLNTTSVATLQKVGLDNSFETLQKMGFSTLVDNITTEEGNYHTDRAIAPLAMGGFTYGVTVRDMAQGYTVIANNGVLNKSITFTTVVDSQGSIIIDNTAVDPVAVFKDSSTYIMTKMLKEVVQTSGGTGSRVTVGNNYKIEIGAKTGTTNDNKDMYFCAFTPEYTTAIWYGYDNNKHLGDRNHSLTLWDTIFNKIYAQKEANGIEYKKNFDVPSSIVTGQEAGVEMCMISGKIATEACRRDLYRHLGLTVGNFNVVETDIVLPRDAIPTEECDLHVLLPVDMSTQALCIPGCTCETEGNVEYWGFRIIKDKRAFYKQLYMRDAGFTVLGSFDTLPDNWTVPTQWDVPYYYHIDPDASDPAKAYYGASTTQVWNDVCLAHYHPGE